LQMSQVLLVLVLGHQSEHEHEARYTSSVRGSASLEIEFRSGKLGDPSGAAPVRQISSECRRCPPSLHRLISLLSGYRAALAALAAERGSKHRPFPRARSLATMGSVTRRLRNARRRGLSPSRAPSIVPMAAEHGCPGFRDLLRRAPCTELASRCGVVVTTGPLTFGRDQERVRQRDAAVYRQEADGGSVSLRVQDVELLSCRVEAVRPLSEEEHPGWLLHAQACTLTWRWPRCGSVARRAREV
jgi:hypothetical protein